MNNSRYMFNEKNGSVYDCWLRYDKQLSLSNKEEYGKFCENIFVKEENEVIENALNELNFAVKKVLNVNPSILRKISSFPHIFIGTSEAAFKQYNVKVNNEAVSEGYTIMKFEQGDCTAILIVGNDTNGVIYGVFSFIKSMLSGKSIQEALLTDAPKNQLRMINHWDNISGDIERGYSGKSFLYSDNTILKDYARIKDYARLIASVGINGIVINNVNVHEYETKFITEDYLPDVAAFADIFRKYGIKTYLSVNFAAPMEIDGLESADPLDETVKAWWKKTAERIYSYIPDFGGFLVKADSEHRPGPFTYGRDHAQGANLLAEALKPFGGIVIWRCFVYNCELDWRDRSKDRAKAAYENFKPLDGKFMDNVILQVKNGPMDFQIREPLSPLFGGMEKTSELMEFEIAQEYTGQQIDLCYLIPMWKECLDFDTYAKGKGSYVKNIVNGSTFGSKYGGVAAVGNLGDSKCWTGNPMAQANLYGFGRLAWDTELTSEEIALEWIKLTFGLDKEVTLKVLAMLLHSREAYEKYTSPLGIGWMVNPNYHYGPSVDGYEYDKWGTYHYADFKGFGVDRTVATGTGYTSQYKEPNASMYEDLNKCPDELLLFFHHVPYTHVLKSGKTVIQHIYDTHFEGFDEAEKFREDWISLKDKIDEETFNLVLEKFDMQLKNAREWRDIVNTYFYRKTGIKDIKNRRIYE